ncbi:hypothetical protein [Sulfolobus acidocaldarius]|uniref:Uncharacterized protein n=4 Tax=Sulfolobus acidocaldarius TaxID=2285 RepID=Q4JAR6_SULAC|nr:hypothetical protein [Sulfolobus acidocaldarius]AAY80113.1 hypothetical protein Saci_0735 [Sulfolobus acidocaldarius DSM 639]AGE70688.1 hypothetical protein SacN8_03575 [Sulfolobus acidocaldarius N8]AGE72960.1 hypothetical protein SacRon12I_03560 [Sulfolobus acidocaldarius Ron12/I]ALU28972.1 hypothetical protein ATY89_02730 [Sulfolobus acidocaldarius]ALU31699.1 hypothetical protein ATZ20_05755 [Sulfolobus acidocaldarius]
MEEKSNSFLNKLHKFETKVVTLGIYTLLHHEQFLGKEVSLRLYGLDIDLGVILPHESLRQVEVFLHIHKTLNVDTSGNVGKETYGIYLFGRKGLSIHHGYLSVPIQSVSNLEDAIKIISAYKDRKTILARNITQIFLVKDDPL